MPSSSTPRVMMPCGADRSSTRTPASMVRSRLRFSAGGVAGVQVPAGGELQPVELFERRGHMGPGPGGHPRHGLRALVAHRRDHRVHRVRTRVGDVSTGDRAVVPCRRAVAHDAAVVPPDAHQRRLGAGSGRVLGRGDVGRGASGVPHRTSSMSPVNGRSSISESPMVQAGVDTGIAPIGLVVDPTGRRCGTGARRCRRTRRPGAPRYSDHPTGSRRWPWPRCRRRTIGRSGRRRGRGAGTPRPRACSGRAPRCRCRPAGVDGRPRSRW